MKTSKIKKTKTEPKISDADAPSVGCFRVFVTRHRTGNKDAVSAACSLSSCSISSLLGEKSQDETLPICKNKNEKTTENHFN